MHISFANTMYHQKHVTGLLFMILLPFASADLTTIISPTTGWGTWEGWGVSLAWWAAKFGQRKDLADLFFTTSYTTFNGISTLGLGLNVVRYNAGATSWNTLADGSTIQQSPKIISSRLVEGFWLNPVSSSPTSSSWNWAADANQRNMLTLAQARGANHAELFSNAPMWWQSSNHNPSGNNNGAADNLLPAYYNSHAVYLASIALMAKSSWGITFASVDAFNEPIAGWWTGTTGTQEGCHFATSTQATVIGLLRTELNSRGLSGIMVSASDENTYDQAVSTWNALGSTARATVGRINVHGYQYANGRRGELYKLASAAGKKLWQSEYGEGDATGSRLVSNLMLDLIWLHPTAWVYWQAIDHKGWGLVDGDVQGGTIGAVSQKYYVLAQFTRHIREGMLILDGGSDYSIAAYDASTRTLVIVAVNWGAAQYLNFDLSKFKVPGVNGALVARWTTQIGSGLQYTSYSDTYISGKKFWSHFATNQVMTFEVKNVTL